MRLQTFYLINIQLEKKNRFKSLEKMMPFDFDKKESLDEIKIPTQIEWDRLQKRYGRNKRG